MFSYPSVLNQIVVVPLFEPPVYRASLFVVGGGEFYLLMVQSMS